jgi:hypothetical protein
MTMKYRRTLESVFAVGRLDRAAPRAVELGEHLFGRRVAGIDDPVERLQITCLITA